MVDLSQEYNLGIHTHIAETKEEFQQIREKYDCTPLQYLEKTGALKRPVLAAHCIYITEEDMDLMAQKPIGVAYNPQSNMKLGSGIAPVTRMLSKGIKVGIGTDGTSSNNNLDLIEEARSGSFLQKVNDLDSTALPVDTVLKMLTVNGAKILGFDKLGVLKEGYLADIILIGLNESTFYYPHYNNLSNLFYAGSGNDVTTVIVNGRVIMKDREVLTINEEEVYYKIEEIARRKL